MTHFEENIKQVNNQKGVRVLYDKGVNSQANKAALKEQKLRDGIMRKKPKGKTMSHWSKLRNKAISNRRFVVECTFGRLKLHHGLGKARHLGIERNKTRAPLIAMSHNLKTGVTIFLSR